MTAATSLYPRRRARNAIWTVLAYGATALGLAMLTIILATLLWNGFGGLSLDVFTKNTAPPGVVGGLLNSIVGSIIMTAIGLAIGAPLGILAGTYLAEYGANSRLAMVVRFINDILLSAPSIIVGLFIYELLVVTVGHFSALAGGVSLAVLGAPIMVRTTEDMLNLVPNSLREAASALGMPRSLVIRNVAYRAVASGIITGILLAIARMTGETAPLIFTALGNSLFTVDPRGPMSALPLIIYEFARSPYAEQQSSPGHGALILTFAVLGLSIMARVSLRLDQAEDRVKRVMRMSNEVSAQTPLHAAAPTAEKVVLRGLNFYYGKVHALKDVDLSLYEGQVTAFIGPSGCGKSTLLEVLNRMYDLYPGQRAEGEVMLDGENILSPGLDLNLFALAGRHGVPEADAVSDDDL